MRNDNPSKELEGILREIEGGGWYKKSSETSPAEIKEDKSGQIFHFLFDLDEIQEIQDAFCNATGVASVITTTTGVPITTPSNFCSLCKDIIRQTEKGLENCFRSDAVIGRHNPDGPIIQRCLSGGLWDAGASITAGDIHIANWLIGQVRNEGTDINQMKRYAQEIGADETAFLSALHDVTFMSKEQFEHVSKVLFLIANQMSQRAYQNLQQRHLLGELKKAEEVISKVSVVVFHWKNEIGWPVEFVSDNVEGLLGYTAEDFISGRIPYEKIIYPEDLERVREEVSRSTMDTGVEEFTHESYRIISKTGEVKWVNDITRIVRNSQGEVLAYKGVVIDVTERKQIEMEKEELETKLQRAQKMELIGTLAGGVAHDLNNILGGIVTYPDLLLERLPENSPFRESIQIIQKSGIRAADIVQDLLTLARRGVVEKEVVNLNVVIENYLQSLEYKKCIETYPSVTVETDLERGLLNIEGSTSHLSKVVMNMIANALEAIPIEGTIRIKTENQYFDKISKGYENVAEGDYVVFMISDDGSGICPEDIDKIFEPFYTKKVMGRKGTGLGMAVVWGVVKDHDGYITVDSGECGGTTFKLYFPISRKEILGDIHSTSIDDYMGNGQTILVVDDIEEQRMIAFAILSTLGYSVFTVSSGEEAIEFLKENSVDLLVLDMIMEPGLDGLDTYKEIIEIHPQQKAIIASGFSETERVRECCQLGAGVYIKKPYTVEKIGMAVKQELERKREAYA